VAYDALTWKEPDLEDVYLDLTGESVVGNRRVGGRTPRPVSGGDA